MIKWLKYIEILTETSEFVDTIVYEYSQRDPRHVYLIIKIILARLNINEFADELSLSFAHTGFRQLKVKSTTFIMEFFSDNPQANDAISSMKNSIESNLPKSIPVFYPDFTRLKWQKALSNLQNYL